MLGALFRHLSRLLAVFGHRQAESDLTQELESHFAMLVDEHRRRGLTDEEARPATSTCGSRSRRTRQSCCPSTTHAAARSWALRACAQV